MTIQELDKEIELRKEELDKDEEKGAYDYFVEFASNNKLDTILDFVNLDIWEFIKCSLSIYGKYNINYYCDLVDKYKAFFDEMKVEDLDFLHNLLYEYKTEEKMDFLIELFNKKGIIKTAKKLAEICETDNDKSTAIKLGVLKKKIENSNIDFIPFLEEVKNDSDAILYDFPFYIAKRMADELIPNEVKELPTLNDKELIERKNKLLKRILGQAISFDSVVAKMRTIKVAIEEYEKAKRNSQREKNGLDNAREYLEKELDKTQIVMYRDIIKGIKNPKIKYLFLKYIEEHNEIYCEELEEELDRLKQNSKVAIQALLNDYGINKNSYDYESLPKYTKEEFETILKVLSRINISNEEKIRIIKSTNIDKINILKNYLDREIINPDYISKNTYILDEESNELDNLKENIEILKNYNISVALFNNSINILMNDSSLISNNLNILNNYNLIQQLISTNDFRFLLSDKLELIIDKYLELGYEEYLESDLNLLNKKELDRLDVLKAIGIPITSKEELEFYLNEEKEFFIPLEEIHNYLIDDSIYVEEPVEVVTVDSLEQYKLNRVYNFNGVIISIEKVNRLLNNGYSLYQSIINNTHLSEDELLNIVNIISNEKGLKKVSC